MPRARRPVADKLKSRFRLNGKHLWDVSVDIVSRGSLIISTDTRNISDVTDKVDAFMKLTEGVETVYAIDSIAYRGFIDA